MEWMASLNADLLVCTRKAISQSISEVAESAVEDRLAPAAGDVSELSARERAVLILLCKGLRNNEIAVQLQISTRTVKWYVSRLLSKFDVTNRTELVGAITEAQFVSAAGRS